MTETAKSKIKNFKNQITEKFNVGEANGFRTYIGKLSPINVLDMLDDIERSVTTDKLSVEKLQEIRVEELKDFNSKILQAELKNQKLQKEIDAAKKYIEESYKADKEDNKLLDLIIEAVAKLKSDNETLKKALTESKELLLDMNRECDGLSEPEETLYNIISQALAATGGNDE